MVKFVEGEKRAGNWELKSHPDRLLFCSQIEKLRSHLSHKGEELEERKMVKI